MKLASFVFGVIYLNRFITANTSPWVLLSSQYNRDYGGVSFQDRSPLDVRSYIDEATHANVCTEYVDNGLEAGTYHFTVANQTWYTADNGKTFQFMRSFSAVIWTAAWMSARPICTASMPNSTGARLSVRRTTLSDGLPPRREGVYPLRRRVRRHSNRIITAHSSMTAGWIIRHPPG